MFEKFVIYPSQDTIVYQQNGVEKFTKQLSEALSVHGTLEDFKNWAVTNGISVEVKR